MKAEFKKFIQKLQTDDNKSVLEAVEKGFDVIFEGYADVRDIEREDALTMFNKQAAQVAMGQGNPVLQFLQNSAERNHQMYTFDEEPELDGRDTIDYREYLTPLPEKRTFEDEFGLTASDLADDFSNNNQQSISGDEFELNF